MFGRRRRIDEATAAVRHGYDRALLDAGIVLFQQVTHGEDSHYVSSSIADLLGWDATAFRTPGTLRRLVHPDDLSAFRTAAPIERADEATIDLRDLLGDDERAERAEPAEHVVRFLTSTGTYRPMLVRVVRAEAGQPLRGSLIDASVGAAEQQRIRRLAEAAEVSHHGHLLFELVDRDDPGSVVFRSANGTARRIFDLDRAVVDGGRLDEIFDGPSARFLQSALFDVAHTGESLTAPRVSFSEVQGMSVDLRIDRLRDGSLAVTIDDVTESLDTEQRLRYQAMHDQLTGLPNRTAFDERLALVAAGLGAGEHLSVVLVDVDGLDGFNRVDGRHVGDQVLVELGRRLDEDVVGIDVVARIGGNAFAVLGSPDPRYEHASELLGRIRDVIDRPVDLEGDLRSVACTIGAALAPLHGQDATTLLRAADSALRQARGAADILAVFDPVEERSVSRRVGLLTELRRGLANQELALRYQPMIDLRTGRVTRVEALLRWQRSGDDRGRSVELVEMAERSGLIEPLTRWVLGESARAADRLARDHDGIVVSTDLSMDNLGRSELMSFVDLLVTSGDLTPSALEIELSEPELMRDPMRAAEVVTHLHELGLGVVVDDFGTGYMSVATVASMPVRGLKIDRGYTTAVSSVSSDAEAVASTIELAHDLGLSVTALGVTDAAALSRLTAMGCDRAQGLHLSDPVPFEDLPARVAQLEHAMGSWLGAGAMLVD